jgi:hypothetical protein
MKFTDYKIRSWMAFSFGILVLLSVASGLLALRELSGRCAGQLWKTS